MSLPTYSSEPGSITPGYFQPGQVPGNGIIPVNPVGGGPILTGAVATPEKMRKLER